MKHINSILHIAIWTFIFLLPVFVFPVIAELLRSDSTYMISYLLSSGFMVALFYLNYAWALPKLFFNKKKWTYVAIALPTVFIFIFLYRYFLINSIDAPKEAHSDIYSLTRGTLLKTIMVYITSWIAYLVKLNRSREAANRKAELSSLKSQINPHFLFNTLNTIYGQALMKSDDTAESISKLSSIMRYSTQIASMDSVKFEQERIYLEDFIALQKLRLTSKTHVVLAIYEENRDVSIPPLLFINFIENAFKYGVSNEVESSIFIKLETKNGCLIVSIKNAILNTIHPNDIEQSSGIKNAIKRLDILYGNRYTLTIDDSNHEYKVELIIPLK